MINWPTLKSTSVLAVLISVANARSRVLIDNGFPRDPTSAHWYDAERFGRYMAAHIARDEDRGHPGRTVREFISELRGLARSDKQKTVLDKIGATGMPLALFFGSDEKAIARLLSACQEQTNPVKPADLGLLGKDHLLRDCLVVGGAEESFRYSKLLGTTPAGLPIRLSC